MAAKKFKLESGEQIIKQETAIYIKGKIRGYPGKLVLTNNRLVFQKTMNFMFGLLGMLISSIRGRVLIDLPLSSIAGVERTKFGLNKNVLLLKAKTGEEHKITISKTIEEWIAEISGKIS